MSDKMLAELDGDDDNKPFNAGDRQSVRSREKEIAQRTKQISTFLYASLQHIEGRTTIHELLRMTGIWAPIAGSDPNPMLLAEGARRVGLRLWEMAWRANPTGFKLMLDEHETDRMR